VMSAMSDDYQHVEVTSFRSIEGGSSPFRTKTQQFLPPKVRDGDFQRAFGELLPTRTVYAASADRTLIAELEDGRMTLHDRDGNERWMRTARGAIGLAWNANDELIAYGQGVATVDLETGDFIDARCGWQFGVWEQPRDEAFGTGQMCVER